MTSLSDAAPSTSERILEAVHRQPGISDRHLAVAIFGVGAAQQRVNGECRSLASKGLIDRRFGADGLIGNCRTDKPVAAAAVPGLPAAGLSVFSEDELKTVLKTWLEAEGWTVDVAWGRLRGIDLHCRRGEERWVIEAKGGGSLDAMRVNYFLNALGETLQRMDDPAATYSIALPDLRQFRNLWARLPGLAKERTGVTALFVRPDGAVDRQA